MRKAPSKPTIKKLFALSGNLCAFPECKNYIVDDVGNLIGQICHIEAAEEGGERYNQKQTDDERASFENLILLCANHHITTNDTTKYTVGTLTEMKKNHEERFTSKQYQPTDNVIDQAVRQIQTQSNTNTGSGRQTNYQAITMTVNSGMSTTDVIGLVQTLYDANFPKLALIAREAAAQNIAKFEAHFRDEVSKKLSSEELNRFSNPDIQVALYEAVQAAARKDSDILRKMLGELVIQRVKNEENELKQKVLNEAIPTVAKITQDQLKILVVCFLLKHASFKGQYTWDAFKAVFERNIKSFMGFKATRAEIFHLQYAGCGKIEEVFTFDLADALRAGYSFVFLNPLEESEIQSLGVSEEVKQEILVKVGDGLFFNSLTKGDLKKKLEEKAVGDYLVERVTGIYESKLKKSDEIKAKFVSDIPWAKELFDRFQGTSLNHLSLTSVGMAIAIAYFEQVVGGALDIDIWIN